MIYNLLIKYLKQDKSYIVWGCELGSQTVIQGSNVVTISKMSTSERDRRKKERSGEGERE